MLKSGARLCSSTSWMNRFSNSRSRARSTTVSYSSRATRRLRSAVSRYGRRRRVLRHEAQRDFLREPSCDEADDIQAVLNFSGQDQVPDDDTTPGDAAHRLEPLPRLTDHLPDRIQGLLRVIGRSGAVAGIPFIAVFEIRQPDIDNAVEQADHIGFLIPAAVVYDRKSKAPLGGGEK